MLVMKPEHVEEWVASEFPGETVRSHLFASKFSPHMKRPGSHQTLKGNYGDRGRADVIESLDLDDDKRIGTGVQNTVYALTDRQLVVIRRGGFRDRPKETLHAGPREGLTVYWYDGPVDAGNQFRQLVFVFADGMWRGDRTGVKALGRVLKDGLADQFIDALGDAAVELH